METSIVTKEDMSYLMQQSAGTMNMIISGMTALLNDNEEKAAMLETQTWFQRMARTITGKNKMTQEEIRQNHEKINVYMSQALTELYKQNCIDHQIMLSLGNQMNELYAGQLQLKQMLGAFVTKLNEKINSIDNFHMLTTEIEQGVYSHEMPLVAVCKILLQLDKRTIQDSRKMDILYRDLMAQKIINNDLVSLADYLLEIADIPSDSIGAIYLELQTIKANYIANLMIKVIESYHYLPDMARKFKNKQAVIEEVIISENLMPDIELSIDEVYKEFINSKIEMFNNQVDIKKIEMSMKIEKAVSLYLECNFNEAYPIILDLANQNNGRAMYFLGEYYFEGFGDITADTQKALEWWKRGKEAGDALAGLEAVIEDDIEKNRTELHSLFLNIKKLSEEGDVFAQYKLAKCYRYGYGIEKDPEKALDIYRKAAELGYADAQNTVGFLYQNGIGAEKNGSEAVTWYQKAVDLGYAIAELNLGVCYERAIGVEQDRKKAVELYKKSANKGYKGGQEFLANCYRFGRGVEKNEKEAAEWFKKAAEQGMIYSQVSLGFFYENGMGVEQNNEEAVKWYRKAADQNDTTALNNLGVCYECGTGVEKDLWKAVNYYRKAAELGDENAQTNLAVCYLDGRGVSKDRREALKWFEKAAEQGDDRAKKYLRDKFGVYM